MPLTALPGLLKETLDEWNRDKAPRLGAALAYYTIFSIAPLLVIVIAITGLAFGAQAAKGQIVGQLQGIVGDQSAQLIQTMIDASWKPTGGIIATGIGLATLILGALGVFGALQDALNTIWEVQPRPGRNLVAIIRDRFLSLAMFLGAGFLLLMSLVAGAVVTGFGSYLDSVVPGSPTLLSLVNLLVSFVVATLLMAIIYKVLPDAQIAWNDVWVGAILTAVLSLIGRLLISLYLARTNFGSTYGAAGSLIAVLVWIYYSAQILLFGAEFTHVFAKKYGTRVKPADNAEFVTEEARAHQGMAQKSQPQREMMPGGPPARDTGHC